ncbi:MAG: nucleotidyltransferase [Vezdaea aestivalis]|nr:MAG: nucleotidyltransferase [Vezdaea aestivalis]
MPSICAFCTTNRATILRPSTRSRLCTPCFISALEREVHELITSPPPSPFSKTPSPPLYPPNCRIAIGASGGKDSTVLASILHALNDRYKYNWTLCLLSIDEGITGYRDDSLKAVGQLGERLGLQWRVVGFGELYGWTMDGVVKERGREGVKKGGKGGSCSYCGVWRRQALDRGVGVLEAEEGWGGEGPWRLVTGHNADDVAETVMMNLLRGDSPRLSRCTQISTLTPPPPSQSHPPTSTPLFSTPQRSKPLLQTFEKEIVLYAHHRRLPYFSTECIYSPDAFRGSARALIKNLERVRPQAVLDLVRGGAVLGACVPGVDLGRCAEGEGEGFGGCGGGEEKVEGDGEGKEVEITMEGLGIGPTKSRETRADVVPLPARLKGKSGKGVAAGKPLAGAQKLAACERCGYLTSQRVCKACVLVEELNRGRAKVEVDGEK